MYALVVKATGLHPAVRIVVRDVLSSHISSERREATLFAGKMSEVVGRIIRYLGAVINKSSMLI